MREGRVPHEDTQMLPSDTRSAEWHNPFSHWDSHSLCRVCGGIQDGYICQALCGGDSFKYRSSSHPMATAMKVLYVLWLILAGLLVCILALITFPLLLLYVGVKIIGGFASKLN